MRNIIKLILLIILGIAIQGCDLLPISISNESSSAFEVAVPSLDSEGLFKVEQHANQFGCSGGNQSPEITWQGVPEGTQSLALTIHDEDGPMSGGIWHWEIFNIPPAISGLVEGAGDPAKKLAPEGSVQAFNDMGSLGYLGTCPPKGGNPHRYTVTVYALETETIPFEQFSYARPIIAYLQENAIATASITVHHRR